MRRALDRLVLAAVMAVAMLVAACGHGAAPTQAGGQPPAAQPPAVPAPAAPAPAAPPPAAAAPPLQCATPAHPYPVVLVPGTFDATSWSSIEATLDADGYCVRLFTYPRAGTGPIAPSARELGRYVNRVLASTHATRAAIVAHSEGGVVARYYVRFFGGAAKVKALVALSPPNHGTTTPLVIPGAILGCVACVQQAAGSTLLAQLNTGNGTPPPVDYTVIQTRYDAIVTPYQSAFLQGPASRVTNIVLQGACPWDFATHLTITDDPVAVQWVQQALASNGPANPSFTPSC